jgi:hypothetical protein
MSFWQKKEDYLVGDLAGKGLLFSKQEGIATLTTSVCQKQVSQQRGADFPDRII